jgi:hypothetical protein
LVDETGGPGENHPPVAVRVILFYHDRVYLWDLCYSIITWFICESCAILSLHGIFMRVVLFL